MSARGKGGESRASTNANASKDMGSGYGEKYTFRFGSYENRMSIPKAVKERTGGNERSRK